MDAHVDAVNPPKVESQHSGFIVSVRVKPLDSDEVFVLIVRNCLLGLLSHVVNPGKRRYSTCRRTHRVGERVRRKQNILL